MAVAGAIAVAEVAAEAIAETAAETVAGKFMNLHFTIHPRIYLFDFQTTAYVRDLTIFKLNSTLISRFYQSI